ncbi:MAG: lipocalin family protein, partial [bacterium]
MKTILLLTLLIPLTALPQTKTELSTVDSVDLRKYVGLWYEVEKILNMFQKKCVKNTTAEYTLMENGKIRVVNRCVDNEEKIVLVKGRARVVDTTSNAKLKVSFVRFLGLNLFWGDYWI